MIEVLVTVVILSIAMLGLAMLQAQALSLTTDAYSRTQASILAYDIIDRIRLNTANLDDYDGAAAPSCNQTTVSAANDLSCWNQRITEALGGLANGTIAVTSSIPAVTVSVSWVERTLRQNDAGSLPNVRTRTASWTAEF